MRELLQRFDGRELQEWRAFYAVEPFGDYRRDLQAGIVAAACLAPYSKKHQAPKASDFLLKFRRRRKQSDDELRTFFRRLAGKDQ